MVEVGILCSRGIFTIEGGQRVDLIIYRSPPGIPSQLHCYAVVKAVCSQGDVPVDELHLVSRRSVLQFRKSLVPFIKQFVGIDEKSVTLLHLDIAESIHGVEGRIIISRIAIHPHTGLPEFDISFDNLAFHSVEDIIYFEKAVGILKENLILTVTVGRRYFRFYRA